jgi:hypothetical protein
MNIVTKTIIIILAICIGSFCALQSPGEKENKIPSESKISFEQEEKSESESEKSKLAILDGKNLKIHKLLKPAMAQKTTKLSSLNPEPPTSPPNS